MDIPFIYKKKGVYEATYLGSKIRNIYETVEDLLVAEIGERLEKKLDYFLKNKDKIKFLKVGKGCTYVEVGD